MRFTFELLMCLLPLATKLGCKLYVTESELRLIDLESARDYWRNTVVSAAADSEHAVLVLRKHGQRYSLAIHHGSRVTELCTSLLLAPLLTAIEHMATALAASAAIENEHLWTVSARKS